MNQVSRRRFLARAGAGAALGLPGGAATTPGAGTAAAPAAAKGAVMPKGGRRVVVIGGGWGGASAARYVRLADPGIEVAYARRKRPSPEMEPYATMVVQLGADDVAAYFAAQPGQPTPIASPPDAVARGRAASAPCVICHGPDGKGDPGPALAGQPPGYLRVQVRLFKEDRRNPGDGTLAALKALMRDPGPDLRGSRRLLLDPALERR